MTDKFLAQMAAKFRAQIAQNFLALENTEKHQKRTVEDVMRTVLWFDLVKSGLSARSAYEVGKKVSPNKFVDCEFDVTERNTKWHSYETGKHIPSKLLIDKVDQLVPGSKIIINHPIWQILSTENPTKRQISEFLFAIDIDLRKLILSKPESIHFINHRKTVSKTLFDALERRYSLDSLAALIILLKESVAKQALDYVASIMTRIYRTCLVLCISKPFYNYELEFYCLIGMRVFKKFNISSECIDLSAFIENVRLLERTYFQFEDNTSLKMWEQKVSNVVFYEYFRGLYNPQRALRFTPPWHSKQSLQGTNDEIEQRMFLKAL